MQYPEFGTVSHGTLRDDDLIETFVKELEWQCPRVGQSLDDFRAIRNEALCALVGHSWDLTSPFCQRCGIHVSDKQDKAEIVQGLMDSLDSLAPPYAYFGALPGDGSDFGFWPSIESLEEDSRYGDVTKVNDLSETEASQQIMLVNDHGNVTYGYTDDKNEFHEVWSVV